MVVNGYQENLADHDEFPIFFHPQLMGRVFEAISLLRDRLPLSK